MAVERMSMIVAALVALTTAPALAQIAGTGEAQTIDCPGQKGTLQNIVSNTEHAFAGGTNHNNPSPLIVLQPPAFSSEHTRMHIGRAENWTADVAIGEAGRCAGDRSESDNLVSFHIASHRVYYPSERIARACTYKDQGQGRGEFTSHKTGLFTVRLYGTICDTDANECTSFRPNSGPVQHLDDFECSEANRNGYLATFAPGMNCGPARWPTKYLHEIGAPPYAEWCDFTVDASK